MIAVLPPQVANLIAAGEVVDRPASVIKELVENAVDAGATAITVESNNGGVTYLRVTDNGAGMSPADANTAFLRHATSKITSAQDLDAISTLGFRGEALAAISSVSRIDCYTREPGAASGLLLSVEAGAVTECREAGCPEGTSMIIRDLFYNTPARMKFLKKDATESGHIHSAVVKAALSRPEIAFRLIQDGRETLNTPGDGRLLSCLYAVYGRDFVNNMTEARASMEDITVSGYVLRPEALRSSRQWQHFFVCGRTIYSRLLTAALESAYAGVLPPGRYPGCALTVSVPLGTFDVNVHPAKTEVRFSRERAVFDAVNLTARSGLAAAPIAVLGKPSFPAAAQPKPSQYEPPRTTPAQASSSTALLAVLTGSAPASNPPLRTAPSVPVKIAVPPPSVPEKIAVTPLPLPDSQPNAAEETAPASRTVPEALPSLTVKHWRCVGEALNAFVLVEDQDELLLIDKHAAHERLLYNRLLEDMERDGLPGQLLLEPCTVRLAAQASAALTEESELLGRMGFLLEDFGGGCVIVRETPTGLDAEDLPSVLEELSEQLLDGRGRPVAERTRSLLHTVACKAAVKAGRASSLAELTALTDEVLSDPELRHCPHGRPLVLSLSKGELFKRFAR